MALRAYTVTQTDTAAWTGDSAGIRTGLEREGLLTRVEFTVEITPSATLTGANQPDGLFRLIQNHSIIGKQTYFNLPADDGCQGGVLAHYINKWDGFSDGHYSGSITAPSLTISPVNFVFHCGSRPRDRYSRDNPFDLTAFIPAGGESQLNAIWTTSGNDVMDDTVTISSAVGVYTLHRVVGSADEIRAEMMRQGVLDRPLGGGAVWRGCLPHEPGVTGMYPNWTAVNHGNAAATTDYDAEIENIVVDGFLKRIAFVCQDATTTRTLRASDELSRLAVRVPGKGEDLFKARLQYQASLTGYESNAEADDAAMDFQAHSPQGIHVIDFRSRGHPEYGLDLRGVSLGKVRLGMYNTTRAAGDDTLFVFERYQCYYDKLAW